MKDSSFGSAAPKSRSINVGANLLGEWISERARQRQQVIRYGALLGASLLLAGLSVPPLWRAAGAAAHEASGLKQRVASLDEQLAIADKAQKAAHPGIVVKAMCDRTGGSFDRFMAQMNRVLGAGNSRMAFASVHGDVIAAQAHIVVQADAEDDGAADAFAQAASDPSASVDGIVTSRPSHLLAEQGVGFQYEKRIGVTP